MTDRRFPCRIDAVTDGDTLLTTIDAGFRIHVQSKVRLMGIDCPELSTLEGKLARDFVVKWAQVVGTLNNTTQWPFQLLCIGYDKRDKYGRWLGDFYSEWSGNSLVNELLKAGHVKRLGI